MNIIIAIIASLISAYIIYFINKKTGKRSYATFVALGLGLIVGAIFKENAGFLIHFGTGYMSLIKMVVIPLVMLSLISSIVKLNNLETLKSIGLKTLVVLLGTTGIASIIGIILGSVFKLGVGVEFTGVEYTIREIPTLASVILGFIPSNPIAAMVDNQIIPIVVFSIFIAVGLVIEDNKNPEKVKVFKDFILGANEIILNITRIIISLIPYAVFALIAKAAINNGMETILSLIKVILAIYIACAIQILVVHTALIKFVAKKSPVQFFKDIFPAQILAFTSQSSLGTLPVTIKSLVENAKVTQNVAGFVASLGTSVGMNACGGIYPAIVAIYVANMFNIDLTMYHYVLIVLTTIVSSVGIAGVPGAATMSTTVVLSVLGLPIEGIAMILAVDALIDMMRTMTNVTGASVAALVVDETQKRKKVKA